MDIAPSPGQPSDEDLRRNRLLASLPREDRALLLPHLALARLERGDRLFEPGEDVESVHFPCDATMVSLIVVLADGESADTGLIGCEGALGGVISRGRKPAFARAVVQIPGEALRMDVDRLEAAKMRSPALTDAFARYADCLLAQFLLAIACNSVHSLEQRMARCLILLQDRHRDRDLPLTQEYLGEMLGVSRTYVTRTAAAFQAQGLIGYARGRLRVLDRAGLGALACPCQAALEAHFERVLPGVFPIATS